MESWDISIKIVELLMANDLKITHVFISVVKLAIIHKEGSGYF